jgi:hypothetical protein
MPAPVEDVDNTEDLWVHLVVDAVWVSFEQPPPEGAVDRAMEFRRLLNAADRRIRRLDESCGGSG